MPFNPLLAAGVAHLLPGAHRVVRVSAGVRPGEHVVIVTDVERPPDVATALAAAVSEVGGIPLIVTMPPVHRFGWPDRHCGQVPQNPDRQATTWSPRRTLVTSSPTA